MAFFHQGHPLVNARTVLFIPYRQSQIDKFYAVLHQRVGSYHQPCRAIGHVRKCLLAGLAFDRAAQKGHWHGREAGKCCSMLAGQNFGRGHNGRLCARFCRTEHGQQGDKSFTCSHIPLQEPAHTVGGGHVCLNLAQHMGLPGRKGVTKGGQSLFLQGAVAL